MSVVLVGVHALMLRLWPSSELSTAHYDKLYSLALIKHERNQYMRMQVAQLETNLDITFTWITAMVMYTAGISSVVGGPELGHAYGNKATYNCVMYSALVFA